MISAQRKLPVLFNLADKSAAIIHGDNGWCFSVDGGSLMSLTFMGKSRVLLAKGLPSPSGNSVPNREIVALFLPLA